MEVEQMEIEENNNKGLIDQINPRSKRQKHIVKQLKKLRILLALTWDTCWFFP